MGAQAQGLVLLFKLQIVMMHAMLCAVFVLLLDMCASTDTTVTFNVYIDDFHTHWSTWDHGVPIFGCFEDCEADIWCRIFDGDGSQVRTSVNWNNMQASFSDEPLMVTLKEGDIIDVKCWDEDGETDDSMGWKHIDSDKFWPCGMEATEFETSKGTDVTVRVVPYGFNDIILDIPIPCS